jgi:hypothetical protein
MKYLLLQFGSGTQMAKILETTENSMLVLRLNSSNLSWMSKPSKLKASDCRILKELSLAEALSYVYEREPSLYRVLAPRPKKSFYDGNTRVTLPPRVLDLESAAKIKKEILERVAALVEGIKADFAT